MRGCEFVERIEFIIDFARVEVWEEEKGCEGSSRGSRREDVEVSVGGGGWGGVYGGGDDMRELGQEEGRGGQEDGGCGDCGKRGKAGKVSFRQTKHKEKETQSGAGTNAREEACLRPGVGTMMITTSISHALSLPQPASLPPRKI